MFIKSKWGPVYHNLDLSMSLLFHPPREGEFTVEVLAFNNISSAVLRKPLFIVHEPCQPPPVKNMGPKKVQVGLFWRNHPAGLAIGCFQTAELAGEWRGLCWVCPAVLSTMKSLWGLWSGVPKQGKPGLGGRPGFYWVNKSFIYLYDWRWAQLALSSFFLFFLFWLYTEWWHFQSKGKSTPKWKEMTNYMLSTKYRAGKKNSGCLLFLPLLWGLWFQAVLLSGQRCSAWHLGIKIRCWAFAKILSLMDQLPAPCLSGPSSLRVQWTSKRVWGCPGQAVAFRCPCPWRQDLCSSRGQHSMMPACSVPSVWGMDQIEGF